MGDDADHRQQKKVRLMERTFFMAYRELLGRGGDQWVLGGFHPPKHPGFLRRFK